MKRLCLTACAIVASLCVLPLRAADEAAKPLTQREKFAACAHESRGMKRDERGAFMSECLRKHSGSDAAARGPVLREAARGRVQPCNTEADRRKLEGEARRAFVSACLKG